MKIALLSLLFALQVIPSWAQSAKWKPKHIVETESASGFQFSPDGKQVLWTKRIPNKEKDRFISKLMVSKLTEKDGETYQSVQLTFGTDSEREALFSKDGKAIYFLSSRSKETTLFRLLTAGGEAEEVHTFKESIENLQFLNESTLLFLAEEGKLFREVQAEEKKDNVIAVEDTSLFKPKRLFSFDLKSKEIKRITTNAKQLESYAVSKKGTWVVTTQIMSPHYGSDGKPKPTYHLYNLKTGEVTEILQDGFQTPGSFQFTNDENYLYFDATTSSNPEWQGAGITEVYRMTLDGGSIVKVNLGHEWGVGYGGWFVYENGVLFHAAKGVYNPIAFVEFNKKGGWTKTDIHLGEKDGRVFIRALSEDQKTVVFTYSTASTPTQYSVASLNKKKAKKGFLENEFPLVKLNAFLDKLPKAKTEIVKWVGANADSIEGVLYYPVNFDANRRYPLVIAPHGGPSAADLDSWSERWAYYAHLMAERGMFILKPNYHGSSNYGQEFVESIKNGVYYDLEMIDILTGIDYLEQRGFITKDSLAAMGWSNGAILSTMLSVRYPDMFKVISAGAGDVNWTSDYGTCQFGVTFDQSYFGGAPWDDKNGKSYNEIYITKSPLFEMEKVKAPTLIFHGSEDRAVPRDQGWEYYRALQQNGKAPVRFLWFPGQGHGLAKLTHQYRKIEEEMRWFETYLFGKPQTEAEKAFKKESPLATLMKHSTFAKTNGFYGTMIDGKLVPEVISLGKDSVSVGRFELTRAQFAAFKADYVFNPAEGNYPVTGISLEDAKAYVKWLSSITGKTYRLPNEKEAELWHKKAVELSAKENTLRYWAGYDVTFDEARLVQQKADSVKTQVVKQVGSFKGFLSDGEEIFDFGGNVREFTSVSGKTIGFGALDFADATHPVYVEDAMFAGFRVVMEK